MSRWIVHARTAFEASHALVSYRGRPEPSHLHRWQVEIRAGVAQLNHEGYSLDFEAVHEELQAAVTGLEGSDLGAHAEIGSPTPSAENLALFVARVLGPRISRLGGTLLSVTIWEGSSNRVDLELEDRG